MYEDFAHMCEGLEKVGNNVAKGLPKSICPLVIGVTGKGRVSQGSLECLEKLPHKYVEPADLHKLTSEDNKCIYISVFENKHLVRKKDAPKDEEFDKLHYYAHPNQYESKFFESLPYVSFLINGIYWEARFPRVLTKDQLTESRKAGHTKFSGISDISADFEGSIEFTSIFTSIEEPFLIYDAEE